MANNNPASIGLGLTTLPTPNVIDVLIVENRDARVPVGKTEKYGSSHPNKAKYPNHKLVFIGEESPENTRPFYYACDWDKQDEYNYEISYPYGRKDAPRYTRTYVLPRDGYQAAADNSPDPAFADAILVGQEMQRIGVKEMDSLYVKVQRTYDTILAAPALDGLTGSTPDGTEYGVSYSFPYSGGTESVSYPMVTWRIPIKHSAYSAAADLSSCPIVGYTDLKLVEQEYQQDPQKPATGTWVRRYEKLPSRVNFSPSTHPQWGKVNVFSFRAIEGYTLPSIGGSFTYSATAYPILEAKTSPSKGSVIQVEITCSPVSAVGVARTNQDINQIFCNTETVNQKVPSSTPLPARGTLYTLGGNTGYVVSAKLDDDDGTNATLTIEMSSSNSASFTEYKLDGETGIVYPETKLYTIGASAPIGSSVDSSGNYSVTDRLDCNYWVRTTSKTTTLTSESYNLVVPASWPAVLESWDYQAIKDSTNTYVAKIIFDYTLKKAYNGHCNARLTRTWSRTTPTVPTPVVLVPEAIEYNGITFSFAIPACLHFGFSVSETTGSNHPKYEYAAKSANFPATRYQNWPSSILYDVNIERYKGGFVKEELLVYAPS